MSGRVDWYDVQNSNGENFSIRLWEPGDGAYCSSRTSSAKVPCTAPVAVVRTYKRNNFSRGIEARTKNACSLHVANAVNGTGYGVSNLTTRADQAARDAVLAAHWDEYQSEFMSRIKAARDEMLGELPDPLRGVLEDLPDFGHPWLDRGSK